MRFTSDRTRTIFLAALRALCHAKLYFRSSFRKDSCRLICSGHPTCLLIPAGPLLQSALESVSEHHASQTAKQMQVPSMFRKLHMSHTDFQSFRISESGMHLEQWMIHDTDWKFFVGIAENGPSNKIRLSSSKNAASLLSVISWLELRLP